MEDKFRKLRPWSATPQEKQCSCAAEENIYLAHKLGPNPFHCLACNGEVSPESLSLTEATIDAVASWNSVFRSLYALWLDSGEYEEWAQTLLLNPSGQVNRDGLNICCNMLSPKNAYYLWFYAEPEARPSSCPCCKATLSSTPWGDRLACHACCIVV